MAHLATTPPPVLIQEHNYYPDEELRIVLAGQAPVPALTGHVERLHNSVHTSVQPEQSRRVHKAVGDVAAAQGAERY